MKAIKRSSAEKKNKQKDHLEDSYVTKRQKVIRYEEYGGNEEYGGKTRSMEGIEECGGKRPVWHKSYKKIV